MNRAGRARRANHPGPASGAQLGASCSRGAVALAACAPGRDGAPPRRAVSTSPIVVDIHCHDFNASDLPITGFIARTIPGLTELSRGVTPNP